MDTIRAQQQSKKCIRDAKFSNASCLCLSGHVESCVLAVVNCTFLNIRCIVLTTSCSMDDFLSVQVEVQNALFIGAYILDTFMFPAFFVCFTNHVIVICTKQCKIHWETPVKMREGHFAFVFAVFSNVVGRAAS